MRVKLAANNYGKSRVRLVQLTRSSDHNDLKDVAVDIQFAGDFEEVHTHGDNRKVLPTDTMKNTVYAMAGQHPVDQIEEFGLRLARHFLRHHRPLAHIRVAITENLWAPIPIGKSLHPRSFLRAGEEKRTTLVMATRKEAQIESGVDDLLVMKTSDSAFEGYVKDAYTTLKETRDRLMATVVKASWLYDRERLDFHSCWQQARDALLRAFAEHKSRSVQHTLYAMGEAVLKARKEIREVRLSLPNKHCLPLDLSPFGLDNRNEIFVPTDEPHGLIEATIRRG